MNEKQRERLVGHPSDYGGRNLEDEERELAERTADGDPLSDRGIADSAVSRERHGDDLQGNDESESSS